MRFEGGVESAQTPDGRGRTVAAPDDGRFVFIDTLVLNRTGDPIDLSCGLPIRFTLVAAGQRFEPIAGLAQIEGNPACGKLLRPGRRASMTWVVAVPATAATTALEFADLSKLLGPHPPETPDGVKPTRVPLPDL